MERLTSRDESGVYHLRKAKRLGNNFATVKVLTRELGKYEDTEFTPEEIHEMQIDLCDARAQLENEPATGCWLAGRDKDGVYVEVCSECDYVEKDHVNPDNAPSSQNYCPNCGSKNSPVMNPAETKRWIF